jgi:hypothetical protein
VNLDNRPNALLSSKVCVSYFTVFFPVFIILAQYRTSIGLASYGLNIIYFGVIVFILRNRYVSVYRDLFILVVVYSLLEGYNLISREIDLSVTINRLIGPFVMIIGITTASLTIDRSKFFQYYEWVVIATSVGILYHSFVLVLSHGSVTPIAILPIDQLDIFSRQLDRPVSFFTEPQAYASFVMPMYANYLVSRHFLRAALLFGVLIVSTSSFGILCAAMLIVAYGLMSGSKSRFVLVVLAMVSVGYFTITFTDLGQQALNKILLTDYETSIRTGKGLQVFSTFSLRAQLFGTMDTVTDYVVRNIRDFDWANAYLGSDAEHLLEYLTTFSYVLVNFGIVGLALYVGFLYRLYVSSSTKLSRLLFAMIVIANFSNTVLFNAWFIFYYVLMYISNRDSAIRPCALTLRFKSS